MERGSERERKAVTLRFTAVSKINVGVVVSAHISQFPAHF